MKLLLRLLVISILSLFLLGSCHKETIGSTQKNYRLSKETQKKKGNYHVNQSKEAIKKSTKERKAVQKEQSKKQKKELAQEFQNKKAANKNKKFAKKVNSGKFTFY